ncbi:glycosyltransferase [Rahnella aceris]|uniref:glycosyltransferase n=1 Tax=Rahnella variigena TaxID=574964 RepID=UPI0028DC167F|nr:glycosyltransferase [Rahnella variigena]
MKKVLIVTPDIEGPVRNGGIGTAFTALAINMAKEGFDVDVLYSCGDYSESLNKSFSDWVEHYDKFNVSLLSISLTQKISIDAPYFRRKSYSIFEWMKENDNYDIVIACEWQADMYYSLLYKKQGLGFANTKFVINTHSSTLWADEGSYQLPYDQNHLELYFMEQKVVEMADEVISPSHYLLEWMIEKNWELPVNNKVILNCKPWAPAHTQSITNSNLKQTTDNIELIFFGRLETRKGIDIFLKAISKLTIEEKKLISQVTFLGKNVTLGNSDSIDYIKTKTANLNLSIKIITDYDREHADEYIKKPSSLVVIPSLVENSPYTVYECLIGGVNFIASSVGGIPELIPVEQHNEILFNPNPVDLHAKISFRLVNLKVPTKLVSEDHEIYQKWVAVFNDDKKSSIIEIDTNNKPLVSVCLVHFDRPHLLQQAIASLSNQTYDNFEVILVDDGSTKPDSIKFLELISKEFKDKGWKIIRSSNNYLGAARNLAVKFAKGEYLIFMDDDNVAKPHEIETFVKAALNSNADILTTPSDLIFGDEFPAPYRKMTHCWLPLGANLDVASFSNCFGDANSMVRTEVFKELGGFTEDYGLGHEDWEFFAKATLAGFKLMVIPEPLFWYRVANTGMLLSGNSDRNNYRSYRPFTDTNSNSKYAMGLIPSYIKKISYLEQEINRLNSNGHINSLNDKLDSLTSQQQGGWAHDRFMVLNSGINTINDNLNTLLSQQRDGWAHDRFNVINAKIQNIENVLHHKSSVFIKIARRIKKIILH